jgi:transcriptional regulator with XRE-family HTH domain
MLKLSCHYTSLGSNLKRERKDRKLSQQDLARQAMLSIPTIQLLESGQGNLTTFWTVLHTLNVDIVGRNLPPGKTIGERITMLRKRKGISQRELIKLLGVSQPTLIELERHATGRLQTLDRVLTILGAGAYLAPIGRTKAFYMHAGNSSNHHEWESPISFLQD